jgi:hypothetical protein
MRFGCEGLRGTKLLRGHLESMLIRALSFEGAFLWLPDCICLCVEVTHADDDGTE